MIIRQPRNANQSRNGAWFRATIKDAIFREEVTSSVTCSLVESSSPQHSTVSLLFSLLWSVSRRPKEGEGRKEKVKIDRQHVTDERLLCDQMQAISPL